MARGDIIGQMADEIAPLLKAGQSYEKAFSVTVHKRNIHHWKEPYLYNDYFRSVLKRLKKRPSIRSLDISLPGRAWQLRQSAPLRKQTLALIPESFDPPEDNPDSPENWPPLGQYLEEDILWEDKYLVGENDD